MAAFPSGSPLLGQSVTEKLTKTNHPIWKAQILAALRGAQMAVFIDGNAVAPAATLEIVKSGNEIEKVPNPALERWAAQEQQVLSFLLSSLSREILTQVATMPTAADVWRAIEGIFASQSRA